MKGRRKKPPARRNPVAKAARKIRPKVVPDKKRKKLTRIQKQEAQESVDK